MGVGILQHVKMRRKVTKINKYIWRKSEQLAPRSERLFWRLPTFNMFAEEGKRRHQVLIRPLINCDSPWCKFNAFGVTTDCHVVVFKGWDQGDRISLAFFKKCHPPKGTAVFRQTPKYVRRGGEREPFWTGAARGSGTTGPIPSIGPCQAEPVSNFPLGGYGCSVTKAITEACKSNFFSCFKILLKIKQEKKPHTKPILACNIVWPSSLKAGGSMVKKEARDLFHCCLRIGRPSREKSKKIVPPRPLWTKEKGAVILRNSFREEGKNETQRHMRNLCAQATFNKAP